MYTCRVVYPHWEDLLNNSWVHKEFGLIKKVKTGINKAPFEFFAYPDEGNTELKFGPITTITRAKEFLKEYKRDTCLSGE